MQKQEKVMDSAYSGPHRRAAQESADSSGRAQNVILTGATFYRIVEDEELRDWLGAVVVFRAVPQG